MQLATLLAQAISMIAFGWYGASALLSSKVAVEFERYGLANLRLLTGALQVVGSAGLALGFIVRPALMVSAAGFSVMMFLALLVRVKIRDPLLAAVPALVLMCLNLFLVVRAIAPRTG